MIANELLIPLRLGHFVRLVRDARRYQSVTDANKALLNKIHLVDLLVLVVNYVVVQVVLEPSRQEALRNLKEQADILLLVTLGVVEEPTERRYHVFEQIINCNLDLDFIRDIV